MKSLPIVCLLLSMQGLFAQTNDDGKSIEFKFEERVSFFAVNDRYQIDADTIYYADSGFRVYSGYDTSSINGETYVIFRYPDFGKGNKQINAVRHKATIDDGTLSAHPVHEDIAGHNDLILALPKSTFDQLMRDGQIKNQYSLRSGAFRLSTGFMSVPFKLRPKQDTVNFNLTTDVTLGAYIGARQRLSRQANNFAIIPLTLGLSYINVGNSQTSNANTMNTSSVVPGWTWSSGLVLEINGFNIGFVMGQDYASGVGDDWLYNGALWYSFSIGYSFFSKTNSNPGPAN